MELNENVVQTLRNFANINSSIVISEGSQIKTISEARNVLASADIDQSFPKGFGIYDLNEFLKVIDLVDSPRINFEDKNMTISDSSGRSKIKYFYTDPSMLTKAPDKINMPATEVSFMLSADVIKKIKRAAGALGHKDLVMESGDGCIEMKITEEQNSTSNSFSIDIPAEFDQSVPFKFVLDINNLKLLPGDYAVSISSKLISVFTNQENNVDYYISLEKTSKYGA